MENSHVDVLLAEHMGKNQEYREIWQIVQLLLILSHGQATVERGFSFNKEVTEDNLKHEGLIARRLILQAVREAGGVTSVPITKELLSYASNSRNKYHAFLEKQKQQAAQAAAERKRKAEEEETAHLRKKLKLAQDDANALEECANTRAVEAETKGCLSLIAESNALRKRAQEKREVVKELQKQLEEYK